jgi:hypothetical protein
MDGMDGWMDSPLSFSLALNHLRDTCFYKKFLFFLFTLPVYVSTKWRRREEEKQLFRGVDNRPKCPRIIDSFSLWLCDDPTDGPKTPGERLSFSQQGRQITKISSMEIQIKWVTMDNANPF